MIFLTVGHQMPFDRLVRAVDEWAADHPDRLVFAQIGRTDYRPAHILYKTFLSKNEFELCLRQCEFVVGHAGTGTILQASMFGKPLIVLPRLSSKRETRTDHQVGTARHFARKDQVVAALEVGELKAKLSSACDSLVTKPVRSVPAESLVARIRGFAAGD
jgi:UDP-N-acetylglucosamine transferase subunit ALG13